MRRQKRIFCFGLMGLLVWLMPVISSAGAAPQQTGAGEKNQPVALPAAKEELLGELPPEIRLTGIAGPTSFYLSPDGRRFAALGKTDKKKWTVVIDGKAGPEFEEFRHQDHSRSPGVGYALFFSPNSEHVAYAAHSGEDKWVVVVDGKVQRESECVGSFDLPYDLRWASFSPDSQHFAYQAKRCPNKWFMVVDGMEGPEFEYVEADPTFSPNSQHLAYSARTSGKKCVVVLDGKPSPEFEQTSGTCSFYPWSGDLSFSPDGEHLAYKAQRARDKWVMVVDGKEGQEFQQLGSPLFSPHGQHLAYAALTVDKKWVVLLDGKTGPEFEREDPIGLPVDELRFSPDGKHFAYRAKTAPNKWAIVLDGQPGPEFEKVVKGPLFSPDSSRLIYEVLHGPKNFIVVDGKPGPEFDAVPFPYGKGKGFSPWGSSIAEFAFSPNGQHSSYIARRGQKLVVTQDAETGPEFSFIMAGPRFSSDSQHVAYMAGEPGDISVVLDGKTIKSIPVPEGKPLYTPSGSQSTVDRDTAWDRAEGGLAPLVPLWPVLFGGNLVTTLAAKNVNFVEHLTFSPDGQHLVYVVGRGGHVFDGKEHGRAQRRAVLDGREGRQYDADALFNLTFSPDCSHFAFEVHNADKGKSFVVLDGQDGKPYDELLTNKFGWWQPWVQGTLRFAHDNSVTYLAREGRKFYRVTQPLP